MNVHISNHYQKVIDEISNFNWRGLEREELTEGVSGILLLLQAICRCRAYCL